MPNNNIAAVVQLGASTTELVNSVAATIEGSPDSVVMSDGLGNGHRFDASGEQIRAQFNAQMNSPTEGCLSVFFEPLSDFSGMADGNYFLARAYNNTVSSNFCDLRINVASGAVTLRARIGSNAGGSTDINEIVFDVDDLVAGTVYQAFTYWYQDPDDPGPLSHVAGINGRVLRGSIDLDASDYTPTDIKRLIAGNAGTSTTSPAQCIIRDVVFHNSGHWQPRDLDALGTARFNTTAVTDSDIYQQDYNFTSYTATDNGGYKARCYVEELNMLVAVNDTTEDEYHLSFDEGATWGAAIENPAGNGINIRAIWAQPKGWGNKMFLCSSDGKVYRAVKSTNPQWTLLQNLTAADRFVVPIWGHSCYKNHMVWGEYLPLSTGNKIYHSPDGGNTINTILTLPDPGGSNRHHIHAVKYDQITGRLYICTGDTADVIAYSDDHGQTWVTIAGETDHSVNTINQSVGMVPPNGQGKLFMASDTAIQPGHIMIYDDDLEADPQPWNDSGNWNAKIRMSLLAAKPRVGTCFAVFRLRNGTLIAQSTNEPSGTNTAARWAGTPDGLVWVRIEDAIVNDPYGAVYTPNKVFFSDLEIGQNLTVNGETASGIVVGELGADVVLERLHYGVGLGLGLRAG